MMQHHKFECCVKYWIIALKVKLTLKAKKKKSKRKKDDCPKFSEQVNFSYPNLFQMLNLFAHLVVFWNTGWFAIKLVILVYYDEKECYVKNLLLLLTSEPLNLFTSYLLCWCSIISNSAVKHVSTVKVTGFDSSKNVQDKHSQLFATKFAIVMECDFDSCLQGQGHGCNKNF